jgi:nitrogen fixation/metabolism regulation signal transduction histidine kinase
MVVDNERSQRHGRSLETAAAWFVLMGGLPAVVAALWMVWAGDWGVEIRWTLTVVLPVIWISSAIAAHDRVVRPMQLLVNLLGALREGDYSLRGAGAAGGDALGDVMREVNALGETLHRQRLSAVEATALLSSVLSGIDVAIYAFDHEDRVRLANRAGAGLLGVQVPDLIGKQAGDAGLQELLVGEAPRTFERDFPGGRGRWELRRSEFRQDGRPHRLVVLADLSRALREEERQAWQRIVRVLSHEINNSLTPIRSIARSVKRFVERELGGNGRAAEVGEGLDVIAGRAESLGRLMSEYARLARMPKPVLRSVSVSALVRSVAELEQRVDVQIHPAPDVTIAADRGQLEQVLINLVRNATEASLEMSGGVVVRWADRGDAVDIIVEDDGPGLADTANLFVPFFTTKPVGSGIGLVLSRQIAEAHEGTLSLENRDDARGCRATLRIPKRRTSIAHRTTV